MMTKAILRSSLPLLAVVAVAAEPDRSWEHYGGDGGGRRYSPHSEITRDNVTELELAWEFRTGEVSDGSEYDGVSSFKATAILFRDRLYLSTPFNRVIALDAAGGEMLWRFDPRVDFNDGYAEMFTSRGVSVWAGDGSGECAARIFLGTLDARLIALDAATGRVCGDFGEGGQIDLTAGIVNVRRGEYSVTSPPAVIDDLVIVGSAIGDNGGVELDHGDVRAYDAQSGALRWSWDPIPRADNQPGRDTWDAKGARRTGAANAWSILSTDPERGLVFVPTTSPSPDFYGGERQGDNLFSSSIVALDADDGSIVWYFQTVHHDLWDYDVAAQPMLTTIRYDGESRDVAVQGTKMGHVFILDRDSGEPVFPVEERPVPQTDVDGEQTAPTQPFPTLPQPLHPSLATADDVWELTPDHAAYCRDTLADLHNEGMFTPPSTRGTLVYPGNPGGINWGSMAVHEAEGVAITVVKRWPTIVTLVPRVRYIAEAAVNRGGPLRIQYTAQRGTPYGMKRHSFINPDNGMPCLEGPWGTLVAIDLGSGDVRWEVPIGVMPEFAEHPQASRWGTIPAGGPIVTASGVVFAATDDERALYAFDLDDGGVIWRRSLPATVQSTPMTYAVDGRQYVVVTAGGSAASGGPGDYVLAFTLPAEEGDQD